MMMQDKKKAVSVLIARMKKPQDEQVSKAPEKDGAQQDASIGLESAADEIMSAVESKNAKALVDALKSFMEMCDSEHEQGESSEYEQSEEQKV